MATKDSTSHTTEIFFHRMGFDNVAKKSLPNSMSQIVSSSGIFSIMCISLYDPFQVNFYVICKVHLDSNFLFVYGCTTDLWSFVENTFHSLLNCLHIFIETSHICVGLFLDSILFQGYISLFFHHTILSTIDFCKKSCKHRAWASQFSLLQNYFGCCTCFVFPFKFWNELNFY